MSTQRLEASDKVTLLLSFVPYLLKTGSASVAELSSQFDISEKQVIELIELLSVSGVPGDSGSYQHQDLFDINWELFENEHIVELWHHVAVETTPKFSAREAAALVAGLQYISSLLSETEKPVIESLLSKIAIASASLPENILVEGLAPSVTNQLITDALAQNVAVTFTYQSAYSISEDRLVDPIRLDLVSGTSYLRGWCHDRQDIRTFRVDRISELHLTEQLISTQIKDKDLPEELFTPSATDLLVQFDIDDHVLPLISAYLPQVVRKSTPNTSVIEVAFSHEANIPIFVALFPGNIRIKSPERAVNFVASWAQEALSS